MKFSIKTQRGRAYEDTIDYVVVHNQDGEVAILKDHIPIMLSVKKGHIKLIKGQDVQFVVLEQAVVEFQQNVLSVLSFEAQIGNTLDEATSIYEKEKKERLELSKKENIDYSKLQKELMDAIKKSKAGQV